MVTNAPAPVSRRARAGSLLGWSAFVLAVSVGGAGLTLALDHPQTGSGRPELTARGDSVIGPRLEALAPLLADLSALSDEVSVRARDAYGDVRNRDTGKARADLTAGDSALSNVELSVQRLRAARSALLDGTSVGAIAEANRGRVAAVDGALAAAAQLRDAWSQVGRSAVLPIEAVDALAEHEAIVLAATQAARDADYPGAASKMVEARAPLDRAREMTASATKAGLDTSSLSDWVVRVSNYDEALKGLYALLLQTGGRMTPETDAAQGVVNAAQAALPKTTAALTVIVADLGGQRMTLGLIALEQLRGEIAAALRSVVGPEPGQ